MSKNSTFRLCSIALLSALSIVFNAYAINLTPDISLSFTYLISFVSGVFMGPVEGFAVGVIGDVIGCIIAPKGPYAPTVTISSGLLGVLPWVAFKVFKRLPTVAKTVIGFAMSFIVCSVLINSTTWYIMYNSKTPYLLYLVTRNTMQLIIVAVNCALACLIYKPVGRVFKSFGFNSNQTKEEIIENDSEN